MIRACVVALALGTIAASTARASEPVDCARFLAFPTEQREVYTWALVEGGIAVRASYQADAIQLEADGDAKNAEGSTFVARAIGEKLRPALRRPPAELTAEIARRCEGHGPTIPVTLVYLETIDVWRREGGAP